MVKSTTEADLLEEGRIAVVAYTHLAMDPRVRREAELLRSGGYEVDAYVLEDGGGGVPGIHEIGIPMPRYRGDRPDRYVASYARFLAHVGARLTVRHLQRPYDLVHVHTMPDLVVLSALPLKLAGVPLVLDVHDLMPEIYAEKFGVPPHDARIRILSLAESFATSLADHVVVPTRSLERRLFRNGVSRDRVTLVHNLPDPAVFGSLGSCLGAETHEIFRIAYHGTLATRLGLDLAIRGLATVREEMDRMGPWRLEVYGDGDARAGLVDLVRRLGLEGNVQFSDGFLPVAELPERLRGVALGLVPSRPQRDTHLMLPTKLLEYLHLGIPVVATPTDTLKEYLGEGQVHFVEAPTPEAWGQAIVALRADRRARLGMARRGMRFFATHNWAEEGRRLLETIRRLTQ
jgi:glycosyltransferase involved in cell wall biosynthesis